MHIIIHACISSHCQPGDYVHGRILYLNVLFVEMYVNVFFVKLFVQRNEFNL